MNKGNAEAQFGQMKRKDINTYQKYWKSITPKTDEDIFRRWLFAFTSIHTSWQGNVRGYNAIKDLGWLKDRKDLLHRLTVAKCGMQNARTKFIWDFKEQFWADPKKFYQVDTNYIDLRNKLVKEVNGIGIAKVSFVLEMCFPLEAELSCLDTHGIQLYELDNTVFKTKKEVQTYHEVESHWVEQAKEKKVSPYIARCLFWNKKQDQPNCRYWSYVLE